MLAKLIELTPYARAELRNARMQGDQDSDLERARKFLVQAMMSVNGVMAGKRGGFLCIRYLRKGAPRSKS